MITKGLMSSNSDEWGTPKSTFEYFNKIHGFTLDACASEFNRKLDRYFDRYDNALEQEWNGIVWCNPPYSKGLQEKFIIKAVTEILDNPLCEKVVMLIPARTDTKNFHKYIVRFASNIYFIKGRISFLNGSCKTNSSPFPSMVIVFDKYSHNNQDKWGTLTDVPRKD